MSAASLEHASTVGITEHQGHSMSLQDLMKVQQEFDSKYFTGAEDSSGKRRHIVLHIGILGGKLFKLEERADHDAVSDELHSILVHEVIPDLLVYAAQLASIEEVDLQHVYQSRLCSLKNRFEAEGHIVPK